MLSRPLVPLLLLGLFACLPALAALGLEPAPRSPFRDTPPPLGQLDLEGVVFALRGEDGSELVCRGRTLRRETARTRQLFTLERALAARDVELQATDGSGERWRADRIQLRGGDRPVEWSGALERWDGAAWVPESGGRGALRVEGGRPAFETYPARVIRGPFERED